MIERHFVAEVVGADTADEALALLRNESFDLVLVNRKLDIDYSNGLDVVRRIKADQGLADTPVMLITNYPQYQDEAVQAGAEPGFGKLQLDQPGTVDALRAFLA